MSETEKRNIRSFINTQIEAVKFKSDSPDLVPSHFLSLLQKKNDDLKILESMLNENNDINQFVKGYFKKVKINNQTTINSSADTQRSRDNSYVLVLQEIDRKEKQIDSDMVVQSFYYRINFFVKFNFGETTCILAFANELKPKNILQNLDLIGNTDLFFVKS